MSDTFDALTDNSLYHYCSTEAFFNIIKSRSIWLTSLSMANDSKEGKIVRDTLLELASETVLSDDEVNILEDRIETIENRFDGLGFCLSARRDRLGQWRGYADDAQGVSIGFSIPHLNDLVGIHTESAEPVRLEEVLYRRRQHKEALTPIFKRVRPYLSRIAESSKPDRRESKFLRNERENYLADTVDGFVDELSSVIDQLYILKGFGFVEEQEWRLLSTLVKGTLEVRCDFRMKRNQIVPFRSLSLRELGYDWLTSVTLGPKNPTSCEVVEMFLEKNGYRRTQVRPSKITYR